MYADIKGDDQTAHMRSLIITIVVRFRNTSKVTLSISKISRVYLVCVAVQAGLYLSQPQNPTADFLGTFRQYIFYQVSTYT